MTHVPEELWSHQLGSNAADTIFGLVMDEFGDVAAAGFTNG
jgi:hypothetical protein